MKKSVVIKAKRMRPINNFVIDYKALLFLVIFICGLIIGIKIIRESDNDISMFICNIVKNNYIAMKNCSFLNAFSGIFLLLFLLVFYIYLFGQCSVGFPFITLAPLFWGMYSGIIISSYYSMFGLKGIGFCSIVYIPCYAITAATLIRGCCIGTNSSNEIFLGVMSQEWNKQSDYSLKNYTVSFLILLIPLVFSSLLKAGCYKLFGDLFVLV